MPQLNDRLYVQKFAWLPVNIWPQYTEPIKRKDFVWLRRYYVAYKYMTVTWRLKDSAFVEDWVYVGKSKNI